MSTFSYNSASLYDRARAILLMKRGFKPASPDKAFFTTKDLKGFIRFSCLPAKDMFASWDFDPKKVRSIRRLVSLHERLQPLYFRATSTPIYSFMGRQDLKCKFIEFQGTYEDMQILAEVALRNVKMVFIYSYDSTGMFKVYAKGIGDFDIQDKIRAISDTHIPFGEFFKFVINSKCVDLMKVFVL